MDLRGGGIVSRLTRWSRSLLFVPAVVALAVFVLGMLRISGSSVAEVSDAGSTPPALLTARPIRSDEWAVRTALVVRQAKLDFPAQTDVGMGVHDTGTLSDLPVKSVSAITKPHSWPYFVLDVERAFALEWWLVVLGPFFGIYAVLAVLTRSRMISALSGVIASAAPSAIWLEFPSMGFSTLYGGLTAALLIVALRSSGRRRHVSAGLAGWTASSFVTLLYLPWLIPVGLLFAAIVLSQVVIELPRPKRVLGIAATFGGVFGVMMLLYLRDHHTALKAIANSVYPGHRVTSSGEASHGLLFDAPFDSFTTNHATATINGTNQSEAASGLMLWLPIAVAGGVFTGFRTRVAAYRALTGVMIATSLLVAWALLPVPAKIGLVFGLTRVQGWRLAYPLTVASAIAIGLYVHRFRTDPSFRPPRPRIAIAALTFAFVTGAAAAQFTVDGARPSSLLLMLAVVVVTVVTALVMSGRVVIGLGGACAMLLFGSVRVNPIQIGLGPLTDGPLAHQIKDVRVADPKARWAYSGATFGPDSVLMASGAPVVTGISWYAVSSEWLRIDPSGTSRNTWSRTTVLAMQLDDTNPEVWFDLTTDASIVIHTPTCSGALQQLDVRYLVSDTEVTSPCLRIISRPDQIGERFIYSVLPSTP